MLLSTGRIEVEPKESRGGAPVMGKFWPKVMNGRKNNAYRYKVLIVLLLVHLYRMSMKLHVLSTSPKKSILFIIWYYSIPTVFWIFFSCSNYKINYISYIYHKLYIRVKGMGWGMSVQLWLLSRRSKFPRCVPTVAKSWVYKIQLLYRTHYTKYKRKCNILIVGYYTIKNCNGRVWS